MNHTLPASFIIDTSAGGGIVSEKSSPRRIYAYLNRGLMVVAFSTVSILFVSFFLLMVEGKPALAAASALGAGQKNIVYLSATAEAAAAAAVSVKQSMQEVHIANNGLILLRGARVVSVSGDTIRVAMAWGSGDFIWTVQTGGSTTFTTSVGEKGELSDIQIGQTLSVTGMLTKNGSEPVISAQYVRAE